MVSESFERFGQHVYTQPAPQRARHVPFIKVNMIDDQNTGTVNQNNGSLLDDVVADPDHVQKVMLLLERPVPQIFGYQIDYSSNPTMAETIDEDAEISDIAFSIQSELVLDTQPWDPTTLNYANGDSLTTREAHTEQHQFQTMGLGFNALGGDVDYILGGTDTDPLRTIYVEDSYRVSDVAADVDAGRKIVGVKITLVGVGYVPNGFIVNGNVRQNITSTTPETTFSFAIV